MLPACTGSQRRGEVHLSEQNKLPLSYGFSSPYRGDEGQGYMLCTTLTLHIDTALWTSSVKVDLAPKWLSQNALLHIV